MKIKRKAAQDGGEVSVGLLNRLQGDFGGLNLLVRFSPVDHLPPRDGEGLLQRFRWRGGDSEPLIGGCEVFSEEQRNSWRLKSNPTPRSRLHGELLRQGADRKESVSY